MSERNADTLRGKAAMNPGLAGREGFPRANPLARPLATAVAEVA